MLFIPGEIKKHLSTPLTRPQSPAEAFILVKCTEQIKGPQESPRSWLRCLLSSVCIFGGKQPVPPSQRLPELCSSLSRCAGHLLPWAVKRKSPLLMLCPLEPVLESLCLQVTPARGRALLPKSWCNGCRPPRCCRGIWRLWLHGTQRAPQYQHLGAFWGQPHLGKCLEKGERVLQKQQTAAQAVLPSMQAVSVKLRDKEGIRR